MTQRTQKRQKAFFWFFLCDFCETFATSAFGCPLSSDA